MEGAPSRLREEQRSSTGGGGDLAFDGLDVLAGQQGVYWNGALRFVVGPEAAAACYDQNGNMTWRLRDGVAYEQTWDYENRLVAVANHRTGETTTFTYDGDGNLVQKVSPGFSTTYVGAHYEQESKLDLDLASFRTGVVCQDAATGTGYIMYSAENVHSRFAAHPPDSQNAEHLICVVPDGGWRYDTNFAYYGFTPRDSDILVAEVDFDADTVTSLVGVNDTFNGIARGYASGNLTFEADVYNGVVNDGEFYPMGSSIRPNGPGATVVKYYFFGSQRIAQRRAGVVQWLLGDHLGTTSAAVAADGSMVAEGRYLPYGGQRWNSGTLPTDYRFTGQRQDSSIQLYQMGARWYDSELGRWTSPDTIIPDSTNPQSLNRYSYVLNQPLRFRDPTGRMEEGECGAWGEQCPNGLSGVTSDNLWPAQYYGMTFEQLPLEDQRAILHAGLSPEQWNLGNRGVGASVGIVRSAVNYPPAFDTDGSALPPQTPDGDLSGQWTSRDGKLFYEGDDGLIYRPDRGYTNKFGNEGENPHWHVMDPGTGDDDTIPPAGGPGGYKWGRRGQRPTPGEWDPERGGYYTALTVALAATLARPLLRAIQQPANINVARIMLLQGGGHGFATHPEFQ